MKRYFLYALILGVAFAVYGVGPILAVLIVVMVFVFKSISDLDRLLEEVAEKRSVFDDGEFDDEEWR
jgi:hypothetical protein